MEVSRVHTGEEYANFLGLLYGNRHRHVKVTRGRLTHR
jgi:hypothetical protein